MTITSTPTTGSGPVEKREDLVTLTIDDIELSVPKGTLVIRAAELIGIEIPRFCDHPLLDPVGACRQCLVEVPDGGNGRPIPKPQASCTLEVAPNMKIRTQLTSPVADKAQHGNIEFLLINHPLDCPICDKGGECPLQNQALSNGYPETRFSDLKRTYPKPIAISPNVLLDRERCVLCARCTRFSEQVAGDPFIALIERGALQQVGIYEEEPFQSYFSGNTIQICPVGALTSAAYRFRARPFDLVSAPSIAEHDACGSAIRVDHRRGVVMRRLAGDDPEVNEEWITDKDRYAFAYARETDRLSTPLVRERSADGAPGVLRPASWPEAIDRCVAGLRMAGVGVEPEPVVETRKKRRTAPPAARGVGVLTGGRLTVEDAYAYSKFARAVLGTNDIDFRARPHSAEEAEFLAAAVAGTGRGVTYADLESADAVLLVCFEPEEEAGAIFLRLRKAFRKKGLAAWTLAPYLTAGARKIGATLISTIPGEEAAVVDRLARGDRQGHQPRDDDQHDEAPALTSSSVIMVGERAAEAPGTLSGCLRLAERTGARLAWIPRRAGDRGAVEAGCLPNLLPGGRPVSDAAARVDTQTTWGVGSLPSAEGRDADEMLVAAADGDLPALIVAGVEPADFVDPSLVLEGLEEADFVISVETRASAVTERADVVLPVSVMQERSGSFLNWEGRDRPFGIVLDAPNAMSDLRVLAVLADALGGSVGIRTAAEARAELAELGRWEGVRAAAPEIEPSAAAIPGGTTAVLASWRLGIDDSRGVDGEPFLLATARPPVARLHPATATAAGVTDRVVVSNDRGSLTFDAVLDEDMAEGVVWVPRRTPGLAVSEHLAATAGDLVTIGPPQELVPVAESQPADVDVEKRTESEVSG
jgi:NADH-quinone oxidoreductase subunit G